MSRQGTWQPCSVGRLSEARDVFSLTDGCRQGAAKEAGGDDKRGEELHGVSASLNYIAIVKGSRSPARDNKRWDGRAASLL